MANDNQSEQDVYELWLRGARPETAARLYGIPAEQANEIIRREVAQRPGPENRSPIAVIREHLARLDSVIEELGLISSKETASVRIRAIEGRFNALKHRLEIHQAVGVLPTNLGELEILYDGLSLADQMFDVLEKHGALTEAVVDDMAEVLRMNPRSPLDG